MRSKPRLRSFLWLLYLVTIGLVLAIALIAWLVALVSGNAEFPQAINPGIPVP